MIKAFIFDIGGTLVKTDDAILKAIELSLKENKITFSNKKEVINVLGRSSYINMLTAVRGSYQGVDLDEKINKCFDYYQKIFPLKVASFFSVFSGVVKALRYLKNKGIKLAVFSGFNREEANFILKKLNLLTYFGTIVTKDDVTKLRPDPEPLYIAMKKLGLRKNECIYVGDTMVDIQMARNAKMKMVCVKTGVQDNNLLKKENPDYFVDNLWEMVKVLEKDL